jgi:UDP-N-acetylmuramoyl-L-alanyl-D-glutamate--2,6-diaminopimelate ligase
MRLGGLITLSGSLSSVLLERDALELTLDSRAVKPGSVFVALKGQRFDDLHFLEAARQQGALAILIDAERSSMPNKRLDLVFVTNLRQKLGQIASEFYQHSANRLHCIGITGTNGKTSTTQLLARALQNWRQQSFGTIGTLGAGLLDAIEAGERTTPDVISLHAALRAMELQGAKGVVMEVSSHALDQGRVDGMAFKGAIFTNLTRDHLDYHGDMDSYAAAKAKLFAWPSLSYAVLNMDSMTQERVVQFYSHHAKVWWYSLRVDSGADLCGSILSRHAGGTDLELHYLGSSLKATLPLLGEFNVSNALAVCTALLAEGFDFAQLDTVLSQMQPVNGRMNVLRVKDAPLVVIDYAHTPDALEKALLAVRAHLPAGAKLRCVFGCGGDRDSGKRPQMGEIAARLADVSIITSDNPRTEVPAHIIADIIEGAKSVAGAKFQTELDRKVAIESTIAAASNDDVILIAGKGHEDYQEINGIKHPFDDAQVANRALQLRVGHAA